jgi:hypothetical protein
MAVQMLLVIMLLEQIAERYMCRTAMLFACSKCPTQSSPQLRHNNALTAPKAANHACPIGSPPFIRADMNNDTAGNTIH